MRGKTAGKHVDPLDIPEEAKEKLGVEVADGVPPNREAADEAGTLLLLSPPKAALEAPAMDRKQPPFVTVTTASTSQFRNTSSF